jgi:hypothetical protein
VEKDRPLSLHGAPDVWDSAAFSGIFLASGFSCFRAESTSAHTQVTQTVSQPSYFATMDSATSNVFLEVYNSMVNSVCDLVNDKGAKHPMSTEVLNLILSLIGMAISLGALVISYLSYDNSKKANATARQSALASERSATAAERSATAAEKSLEYTRPMVNLSNPVAAYTRENIKIYVDAENIGSIPIVVKSVRAEIIQFGKQKLGLDFSESDLLVLPEETHTFTLSLKRKFKMNESNFILDAKTLDPNSFEFKITFHAAHSPDTPYSESFTFSNFEWETAR